MAIQCIEWQDFDEYWDIVSIWNLIEIEWQELSYEWDAEATDYIWSECQQIAEAIIETAKGKSSSGNVYKIPDEQEIDDIVTVICKVKGYDEVIQKKMKRDVNIIIQNIIEKDRIINETIKVRINAIRS